MLPVVAAQNINLPVLSSPFEQPSLKTQFTLFNKALNKIVKTFDEGANIKVEVYGVTTTFYGGNK